MGVVVSIGCDEIWFGALQLTLSHPLRPLQVPASSDLVEREHPSFDQKTGLE